MRLLLAGLVLLLVQAAQDPVVLPDGSALFLWVAEQILYFGPIILFVVCLLETAVFVGLFLPVGALIAFSALLSMRGYMAPEEVAFAALAGAMIGDQCGFAVGRWFAPGVRPARGRIRRLWQGGLRRAETLVGRGGLIGVSAARTIPFVRTIMPWFAGRSGMTWPHFLFFDLIGIAGWGLVYLGGGFAAGYGWQAVANRFGEVAGAALLFAAAAIVIVAIKLWTTRLMRRKKGRKRAASIPPTQNRG